MSYTKGPWHVGGDLKRINDPVIYCNVWGPTPEGMQSGHQVCRNATKDDARLIAAAPELLDLLIRTTKWIEGYAYHAPKPPENGVTLVNEANALIAKAKGRTA